jgi:hypothetical protein
LTVVPALAVTAALLAAAPSQGAGRYADEPGDSNGAPDLTSVSVTGDANGQLLFTINTDNLAPESDVDAFLLLDTDLDLATGAPDTLGADYMFVVSEADNTYGFARWAGSDWDWDAPYSTVRVRGDRTGALISVNRSEVGGTSAFNFWVRTRKGDALDDAPDDGTWNYTLAADGPDIQGVLVTMKPAFGPKAGKPFTITPAGLRLPPSGALGLMPQPESYTCAAKLGTRTLKGTGTGGCTFKLKQAARGKKLTVELAVTYQGASKTSQFVFRVA